MSQNLNWIKPDKQYPKKSVPLSSYLNGNSSQNQQTKNSSKYIQIEEEFVKNTSEESAKITIKDLCNEDKQRIANLIKEIARISEEKQKLEAALEEERKQKENEIKDILKQQQKLLNEKENLLNKLSKIQQKLSILKAQQNNKNTNAEAIESKTNQSSKLDQVKISCQEDPKEKTDRLSLLPKEEQINQISDSFNPFKSSTPRSLSPITTPNILNENNKDTSINKMEINKQSTSNIAFIESRHEEDLKKIELMKQQVELIEEQKKVKELLQKQEDLLKEKQDQIALQQKIHRERLEELHRIKLENQAINQLSMQQNQFDLMSYHQLIQMTPHPQPNLINQNVIPQMIPYQINPHKQMNHNQEHLTIQQPVNDLENINLENLATLVYEKLKVKKKHETSKCNKSNNNDSKFSLSNKNNSSPNSSGKQDYDDYLIDFIIEQNESFRSTKSIDKSKFSNNFKCINTPNKNVNTDTESDKLIEELFFLK